MSLMWQYTRTDWQVETTFYRAKHVRAYVSRGIPKVHVVCPSVHSAVCLSVYNVGGLRSYLLSRKVISRIYRVIIPPPWNSSNSIDKKFEGQLCQIGGELKWGRWKPRFSACNYLLLISQKWCKIRSPKFHGWAFVSLQTQTLRIYYKRNTPKF